MNIAVSKNTLHIQRYYINVVCPQKMSFCGKTAITTFKLIQNAKVVGTQIFKIEEKMTENMMPKVANPPPKIGRIYCSFSHYALY